MSGRFWKSFIENENSDESARVNAYMIFQTQ